MVPAGALAPSIAKRLIERDVVTTSMEVTRAEIARFLNGSEQFSASRANGRRENVSLALSIGRSPRGEMPQPYALLLRVLVRTEFAR
jgi:hypothetical protein